MRKSVVLGYTLGCLTFLFALGCEDVDDVEDDFFENADLETRASAGHTSNSLKPNGVLKANQYLRSSDGSHRFYLQGDGNLVLRRMSDKKSLWSSRTHGKGATKFVFQGDGNLVLYTSTGKAVWASNTVKSGATALHLHSAGKLVLYRNSTVVWSANGAPDTTDECPYDPNKTEPGDCGCGMPEGTCGCGLDLDHTDYCKECGPCDEGEGDCDNDSQCKGDLVCEQQSGVDYCRTKGDEEEEEDDDDDDDGGGVASDSSNTLLVYDGGWKYVYCSGSAVKVSSSSSKKQRWVKRGARSIYNESVKEYLYCPERDGGYAPTECECSGRVENYHQKTSKTGGSAPATISLNRDIYIAPNNNMNACLKVIRGGQVHAPCAIEPWRNQKCREDNGDSFSSSEHAEQCYKFRLND